MFTGGSFGIWLNKHTTAPCGHHSPMARPCSLLNGLEEVASLGVWPAAGLVRAKMLLGELTTSLHGW